MKACSWGCDNLQMGRLSRRPHKVSTAKVFGVHSAVSTKLRPIGISRLHKYQTCYTKHMRLCCGCSAPATGSKGLAAFRWCP